jgi:hypothetical protein
MQPPTDRLGCHAAVSRCSSIAACVSAARCPPFRVLPSCCCNSAPVNPPDMPEAPNHPDAFRARIEACTRGPHHHQLLSSQEPELTGASNATTPTRVNQIVVRGSTTHCSGCGSDCCPIVEDSGTRLRATPAPPSLPGLRLLVQPDAACVLGDQTPPRGCTCRTRSFRSLSQHQSPATRAVWRAGATDCTQKKQFACQVLSAECSVQTSRH